MLQLILPTIRLGYYSRNDKENRHLFLSYFFQENASSQDRLQNLTLETDFQNQLSKPTSKKKTLKTDFQTNYQNRLPTKKARPRQMPAYILHQRPLLLAFFLGRSTLVKR